MCSTRGVITASTAASALLRRWPCYFDSALLDKAIKEVGLTKLEAVAKDPKIKSEAAFFAANAAKLKSVEAASAATPHQWQHWYWVCVGGELVFLPLVLVMAGRWRPKKARQDAEEHERMVQEQLANLSTEAPVA